MGKVQRCLMCGDAMYEMDGFGGALDDLWPERRVDSRYGLLILCPHCDAEHVTGVDRTPGVPPVPRVRALLPRH